MNTTEALARLTNPDIILEGEYRAIHEAFVDIINDWGAEPDVDITDFIIDVLDEFRASIERIARDVGVFDTILKPKPVTDITTTTKGTTMKIILHAGTGTYFGADDGVYLIETDDIPDFDPETFDNDPSDFIEYGKPVLISEIDEDDEQCDICHRTGDIEVQGGVCEDCFRDLPDGTWSDGSTTEK